MSIKGYSLGYYYSLGMVPDSLSLLVLKIIIIIIIGIYIF